MSSNLAVFLRKSFRGALAALLVLGLAACGGSDEAAGSDVTGTWSGNWQNTSPAYTGTITVTVVQNGAQLSGNGTLTNVPVVNTAQGPVSGTVNGSTVNGAVTATGVQVAFQLTLAPDGNNLSGTYTLTPGDFTGNMTLTRQP